MFRTVPRGAHRAPGRAVIDYRAVVAPVGRTVGGAAALGAVTATAAMTGAGAATAHASSPAQRPSALTRSLPVIAPAAAPALSAPALAPALPTSTILRSGSRGAAVSDLQQALNDQGAAIAVDGIFGSATGQAVRALQRSHGLVVDGVVGVRTWGALAGSTGSDSGASGAGSSGGSVSSAGSAVDTSAGTPTLRIGASGTAVRNLQLALRDRGASLSGTAYFGSQTQAAVRAFQGSAGLAVDGIAGPRTWAALGGSDAQIPETGGGTSVPTAPSSSDGSSIVSLAQSQVGKRYVYGSSNPSVGFDCSGLVKYVYEQHGISVPRTARQQTFGGRIISQSEAQPGDLVAFSAGNYGHIGIYAGNNQIVDASGSGGVVKQRAIWNAPHVFVTYR